MQSALSGEDAAASGSKSVLRYELEGTIGYDGGETPMLMRKAVETSPEGRRPKEEEMQPNAPATATTWNDDYKERRAKLYRLRAVVGYQLAFALLYGLRLDLPSTPEPITILGIVEAADICLFLPLIADQVAQLIVECGYIGSRDNVPDKLKLPNHPHLFLTVARKLRSTFIYQEALRHCAAENVHGPFTAGNSDQDPCSKHFETFECDNDQKLRIAAAYQEIQSRVSKIDRQLFVIGDVKQQDRTSSAAMAIWQRWLTRHCYYYDQRPSISMPNYEKRYYDSQSYRQLSFANITPDDLLETAKSECLDVLWGKHSGVREGTLREQLQDILIQGKEVVEPLFNLRITAIDDSVARGFTCLDFLDYAYPWGRGGEEEAQRTSFAPSAEDVEPLDDSLGYVIDW